MLIILASAPANGQAYPTNFPFAPLRVLSGLFGAAVAPIAYWTLQAAGLDSSIATMIAGSLALDNALVTHSRTVSSDSLSIFLTAVSYLAWTKYYFQGKGTKWFLVLSASLGASLSCNWLLGLASILFALLYSFANLWTAFCTQVPMTTILGGSLKSVLGFVLLPLALYSAVFAVHFSLITAKAEESLLTSFSPEFQQHFNPLPSTFETVVYGSTITLRHRASPSLYLHSHALAWPSGSKQQQVTGYSFDDQNNDWIIREAWGQPKQEGGALLHSGDLIRLQHVPTGRFLHSHHEEPPESNKEHHREVSCYGGGNFSDFNDNWRIELVDSLGNVLPKASFKSISAINSTFRLFHPSANCSLSSFAKKLPDYAAGQYEVTCGSETLKYHSVWMIESNQHDSSRGAGNLVQYQAAGFFQRLFEVHKRMLVMVKPKPAEDQQAPWLFTPLPVWSGGARSGSPAGSASKDSKDQQGLKILVLPNPVLWSLGFGSIAVFFLGCFISKARSLDGSTERSPFFHLDSPAGHAFTFWALHTLSFLLTPEHSLVSYFPALYASIMLSSQLLKHHYLLTASIACAVLASFSAFAPLSYGLAIAPEFCERLQLFDHWKFGCSS